MAAQGAMVAKVTGCDRRLGTLGGGGLGAGSYSRSRAGVLLSCLRGSENLLTSVHRQGDPRVEQESLLSTYAGSEQQGPS